MTTNDTTPEPEVRYWRDGDGALWHTTTAAGHLLAERDEAWQEVTVTPVVPQGATTPADERLCEAERIAQALRHVAQEYRLAAATGHLFFTATDSERVPWEAVARDLDERAERMLPLAEHATTREESPHD